jgi:hypothetical protein
MEVLEAARCHGSGTDSPRIQAVDARMKDKRRHKKKKEENRSQLPRCVNILPLSFTVYASGDGAPISAFFQLLPTLLRPSFEILARLVLLFSSPSL